MHKGAEYPRIEWLRIAYSDWRSNRVTTRPRPATRIGIARAGPDRKPDTHAASGCACKPLLACNPARPLSRAESFHLAVDGQPAHEGRPLYLARSAGPRALHASFRSVRLSRCVRLEWRPGEVEASWGIDFVPASPLPRFPAGDGRHANHVTIPVRYQRRG